MIFTQLILAHIIGDFILQPGKWVVRKEEKKTESKELYWHVFIHTALSFILLWNLQLWWMAVIIGISHFIIDALKLHLQTNKTRKAAFFLDQGAHLLVILMISFSIGEIDFNFLHDPEFLKTLTVMVFLTFPASVIIKILLSSWIPETQEINKVQTESLVNAGKYIGILERLLVFTFIVTEHWEGVGFMIAAKSVFRFSDLAEARQRKLTEYVLVGTLLSFGIAVVAGIIVKL